MPLRLTRIQVLLAKKQVQYSSQYIGYRVERAEILQRKSSTDRSGQNQARGQVRRNPTKRMRQDTHAAHCTFNLYLALALHHWHRFPGDVYHSCRMDRLSRINPTTGAQVPQSERVTERTGRLRYCMKLREGDRTCVFLLLSICLPEIKENP